MNRAEPVPSSIVRPRSRLSAPTAPPVWTLGTVALAGSILLAGCSYVFHASLPGRTLQLHPFDLTVDLVAGADVTDTPTLCVELPVGWPVELATYSGYKGGGAGNGTPISGELVVDAVATDAIRRTDARANHTWTCWAGESGYYSIQSFGRADFRVNVPSVVGPFDLRFVSGSAAAGTMSGAIVERRIVVMELDDHLDGWTNSTRPFALPETLLDVAYGNGRFVAVSRTDLAAWSEDARTWHPASTGVLQRFEGLTFARGRFWAVGASETILTSNDGERWAPVWSSPGEILYDLVEGNGTFVAPHTTGSVLTSSDGMDWTERRTPVGFDLFAGAWDGQTFVVVGGAGSIVRSADGVAWNSAMTVPTASDLFGVAHAAGKWIAVGDHGEVLISSDGDAWTRTNVGRDVLLRDVAWGDGVFVAVGASPNLPSRQGGEVFTSLDGETWTARPTGTNLPLSAVTFADDRYVAVGESGLVLHAGIPRARLSGDLDLGTVIPGEQSIAGVLTLDSIGTTTVSIGSIEMGGPNRNQFRLVDPNACRGKLVSERASCAVGVIFMPTSGGAKTATITFTTNDPAARSITRVLLGQGGPSPEIEVADPTDPPDDLMFAFTDVVPKASATLVLAVENRGDGPLVLGRTGEHNELEAPFAIGRDDCSSQTLAPGARCTMEIVFTAPDVGVWLDTFEIGSNDLDEPSVVVTVRASAKVPPVPACPGARPTTPRLVAPEAGARVERPVVLAWEPSTDADGDAITYRVTVCETNDFEGCAPVQAAALGLEAGDDLPGGGLGWTVLLACAVLASAAGGRRRRSGRLATVIAATVLLATIACACAGDAVTERRFSLDTLRPGTTYFWKVTAVDANGCATESAVRSFTTL